MARVLVDIPDSVDLSKVNDMKLCIRYYKDNDNNEYSYVTEGFTIQEERPQGEWIPVSERWPVFSGLYLVSIDDLVTVANFTGAYFINKNSLMLNVSAWQQLPEPYKKGSAE